WAGAGLGRASALWDQYRSARVDLDVQRRVLTNAPEIKRQAAAATKSLVPANTLNATKLVGELSELAVQANLKPEISGGQRTERTDQFAFHTVQSNFRHVDLQSLLNFYRAISKRAPYIALENFSIEADRSNTGFVNASFRIVSTELENR